MNSFSKNMVLWAAICMVMIVMFNLFNQPPATSNDLNYSDFLTKVRQGEVVSVKIQGSRIAGVLVNDQRFTTYAPDDPTLVDTLVKMNSLNKKILFHLQGFFYHP